MILAQYASFGKITICPKPIAHTPNNANCCTGARPLSRMYGLVRPTSRTPTLCRCASSVNVACRRAATMASADLGPMPGTRSSSARVARFTSTGASYCADAHGVAGSPLMDCAVMTQSSLREPDSYSSI